MVQKRAAEVANDPELRKGLDAWKKKLLAMRRGDGDSEEEEEEEEE